MKLNQYEWDPEKDKLGEGTFAEVFKAKDIYANRHVALKIYKTAVKGSTTGSTGESKYSLEQEFQKIQDVSHTNIIPYYGLNYIKHIDAMGREGSHPVIIMEYANQGTLTEFLRTKPKREVLDKLIVDIIAGVGHLHEEGIIHRDLKPGNILVTKNKRGVYTAKITDFGISKDTLSSDNLTKSHTEFVGTPHYMAPEQMSQKKYGLDGRISSRTDLWAIGVIIYKAFTGRLPFGNGIDDIELIREAITTEEFDLTGVPAEYHKLLALCFKKHAKERVSTASDMQYLIGSKGTVKNGLEDNNDTEKTINLSELKEKESVQENSDASPSKTQKIAAIIFGVVSLLWFGYYYFVIEQERFHFIFILYPLAAAFFVFFYLKPNNRFIALKLFIYGALVYSNIFLLKITYEHLHWYLYQQQVSTVDLIHLILVSIILAGLFFWLFFKQLKNQNLKKSNKIYILLVCILCYLLSNFLPFSQYTGGFSLLETGDISKWKFIQILLPNVFFVTAVLFYVYKIHHKFLFVLVLFFIGSICFADSWWILFDELKPDVYFDILFNSRPQKLEIGYYLWFLSIFIGFSIILYDSVRESKFKKMYWPILGAVILLNSFTFYIKWSHSEDAYNFDKGVNNLDYGQFKKAFKYGKPTNIYSYNLHAFVKNMLPKYNDANKDVIKRMLKLFVNSNGLVTHIKDVDLASAITKEDPELLEILLKPTGSTKLKDVDFVHEDKSLLQQTRDLKNTEMEKLLIDAGAELTAQEKVVEDLKKMKASKAKEFNYSDDFTNGSTKFSEASNDNATWSYQYNAYKLNVKDEKLSYYKTAPFNLDVKKPYTVSVKVTRGTKTGTAGVVFDSNNSDYHIAVVGDKSLIIYKRTSGKWSKIKEVAVTSNKSINIVSIKKTGNYVSCYLNNKIVISNELINSIGGNYFGMINSNPNGSVTTYFDDFKVKGTKK